MKKMLTVLCVSACIGFAGMTFADTSPDDAIKYRKNLMNSVKYSVDALVAVTKGEVDQQDNLPELAAAFATAANAKLTVAGFEQNTDGQGGEETTATAKVWDEWEDFSSAFIKLGEEADKIKALADAGELNSFDQIKPALGQCGYCHRKADYRTKKQSEQRNSTR